MAITSTNAFSQTMLLSSGGNAYDAIVAILFVCAVVGIGTLALFTWVKWIPLR